MRGALHPRRAAPPALLWEARDLCNGDRVAKWISTPASMSSPRSAQSRSSIGFSVGSLRRAAPGARSTSAVEADK